MTLASQSNFLQFHSHRHSHGGCSHDVFLILLLWQELQISREPFVWQMHKHQQYLDQVKLHSGCTSNIHHCYTDCQSKVMQLHCEDPQQYKLCEVQ